MSGRGRKRAANSGSGDSKASDSDRSKKKKTVGGFSKSFSLSQELADVVGVKEAPRHEVIKQLWAYIRQNNLLDPKNKQVNTLIGLCLSSWYNHSIYISSSPSATIN
jgi:upstream activation factor subunit UAF30